MKRRQIMKKGFSLLLTGLMMTGMFSVNTQAAEKKGETITMMCWYEESTMQRIIDEVNRQLDGEYVLEYTFVGNSDFNNVISTQLAAGEGPDIVAEGANFPAKIKAGNVQDITGQGYTDGFSEAGLALAKYDDKYYGIPCYGWFAGVFYNKDLFEQAGITEIPETWDEFLDTCRSLTENGIQPFALGLADSDNGVHSLTGYLECNYYQVSEEGKNFDTEFAMGNKKMSGNLNEAVEGWMALVNEGFITPEMVGISFQQAKDMFLSGKAAMCYSGPWDYNSFKEAGLNFGVMPFVGETKENQFLIGGPAANFGINVNTKKQDGAEKVLKALASVEVQQIFLEANAGSSSYREGTSAPFPDEYAGVRDVLNAGKIACCWDRWSVNLPASAMFDELRSQIQGLVAGSLTVDEFLEALDNKADEIRYE